jgi:hypothetical protein
VDIDWIICPTCRTRLNRVCPNCGRLVGLDWTLCAWCGKDFERRDLISTVAPVAQVSAAPLDALPQPATPAEEPLAGDAIRTTVRRSRPGSSGASAASQAIDPLPET